MKKLKVLLIIVLTLGCVLFTTQTAYATDDDWFSATEDGNDTGFENATTTNTNNSVANNTNSNSAISTNNINNSSNNSSNNSNSSIATNSNNTVNTLAKTGLSKNSGILVLIVTVCGISAVYSLKKVNDYKKL